MTCAEHRVDEENITLRTIINHVDMSIFDTSYLILKDYQSYQEYRMPIVISGVISWYDRERSKANMTVL